MEMKEIKKTLKESIKTILYLDFIIFKYNQKFRVSPLPKFREEQKLLSNIIGVIQRVECSCEDIKEAVEEMQQIIDCEEEKLLK